MRRTTALLLAATLAAPMPAIAQTPGQLVSAEPIAETPAGVQAWRVRYWTRDRGRASEVTGIVLAPREALPARPRRVIAWTHGAWGVAEKCAPSLSPNFFQSSPIAVAAAQAGYVVVAPDYPGLGSPGPHPFLVGTSTAHSVLDAVRAARRIPGASAGGDFALWGESQGGHAALWTAQLARRYAPELRLAGAVAIVPPTDLAENLAAATEPNIRALFTAFTVHSWSEHFGAPLSTLVRRPAQGIITRLARNNCITLNARPRLGTILGIAALRRDLKNVDLGRVQPWARIARENSPAASDPGVPLFIATGTADTLVAPALVRRHARRLCADRARVRFTEIMGGTHIDVTTTTTGEALAWIADRFAGRRAPSDCGRI